MCFVQSFVHVCHGRNAIARLHKQTTICHFARPTRCLYEVNSQRLPSVIAGSVAEAVGGRQEEDMASAAEPQTYKDAVICADVPDRDGMHYTLCQTLI